LKIRAGIGYDIHRLVAGRPLFIGGTEIPHALGLLGHSDGDVLIHAVIDALLGALGEKDIGQCFPDTDPEFKDIRSTELLACVATKLKEHNAEIMNLDTIVVAERPKLAPHIAAMKDSLRLILGVDENDLSIKAKTHEGMGEVGEGKAIAAWATVLLQIS
jgi:2-C-methyl-D-erythritol 2,4-cyclodiphosphate synthase